MTENKLNLKVYVVYGTMMTWRLHELDTFVKNFTDDQLDWDL